MTSIFFDIRNLPTEIRIVVSTKLELVIGVTSDKCPFKVETTCYWHFKWIYVKIAELYIAASGGH